MKQKTLFRGIATALATPMTSSGAIDYDAYGRLIDWQIESGVAGLVTCGTTGEASTMTAEEHRQTIAFAVKRAAGRVPVIAGTGANCTEKAVELTRFACAAGADACLVVTPYYNKATQRGLIAHYTAIADASDRPVILYNVPSRTGVNIQPATLQKICRLPQVVAVKEANPDVAQAMEKINLVGDDATFYCGNDDLTIPLMVLGFQGVISVLSNVMPAETSKMTSLALSGNWAEASKMQRDLLPMVKALFCETSPIPCKAAMSMMGMCRNELRLPLIPMQEANQQKLADIMRGWKLI